MCKLQGVAEAHASGTTTPSSKATGLWYQISYLCDGAKMHVQALVRHTRRPEVGDKFSSRCTPPSCCHTTCRQAGSIQDLASPWLVQHCCLYL